MKKIVLAIALVFASTCQAWEGYDGDYHVEITRGERIRVGSEVEYFNYDTGEYSYGTVEDFDGDEMEVLDNNTGEYIYFDMED